MALHLQKLLSVGILAPLLAGGCTDQAEVGRQLYAKHGCAVCHGPDGRGNGALAQRLNPPPRDFADARLYRQGSSRDAIADTIRNGLFASGTSMPAFENISPDEARQLAEWIVSLQKSTGSQGGGSR